MCGYAQDDPAANKTVDACSVNGEPPTESLHARLDAVSATLPTALPTHFLLLSGIGNPDNVAILEDNDILIIGARGGTHVCPACCC